ncbi:hypothetical protein NPX13_g908 [Xylaria arbuscula]|uniref:Cytochrome P450 n=1 Tax=Xylaria arbuscula TaxID=114810 RepID=A0A9W8NNI5_9PEZI|nr:hypothetical protein NPX13_g908 [Xylaria arbuscula]
MIRSWVAASTSGITNYQKDTRALSLNVLAATGFRKTYDFRGSTEPQIDEEDGYCDALQMVLANIILLMLVPFYILRNMSKNWAEIGDAGLAFQKHMRKLLEAETTALAQGKPGSGGIMPSFGLSVEEIFGNLFVINLAGHDTTANTLAFGMLLLAAHPKVQAWLAEEVAIVTSDDAVDAWDYKKLFPHLKRYGAVLYETLRLYPPVPAMPSIASHHE